MANHILIHNAQIIDGNGQPGPNTAIALDGNLIQAIGPSSDILALCRSDSKIIDAAGGTLLPGFFESHMHLFGGALTLSHVYLSETMGFEALRDALLSHAAAVPDATIITGFGANYTIIGDDQRVTRQLLDKIISDRPVYIISTDHHTAWANTAALKLAGILRGKELESEASVVVDDDGFATGELREFEAMNLVNSLADSNGREVAGLTGDEPQSITTDTFEADIKTLRSGLTYCAQHGITKIVNMDGNFYQLDLLAEIEKRGQLICRVELPYVLTAKNTVDDLLAAKIRMDAKVRGRLSSGRFKLFMDGVFDNWTALVTDNYPDRPAFSGVPLIAPAQFAEFCCEADRLDWQISVHAVGDGAVRHVLDGYEAAQLANGKRDSRHRVEHIDTIHTDDIARLRTLGVVASMQPVHPPGSAGLPLEPTVTLMGRARWDHAFAWREIWDAGVPIAFATDWPVSPLDPLYAIRCALTRDVWDDDVLDQRLDLGECLQAYAQNGAYATFDESQLGALRVGYLADVTLIRGDLGTLTQSGAALPQCVLTICDGEITFQADP